MLTTAWAAWIGFIQQIFASLKLPDWASGSEVQAWCRGIVDIFDTLADATKNEIDDTIVDTARKVMDNDAAFMAVYGLILDMVQYGDSELLQTRGKDAANLAGVDWHTLMEMVQSIVALIMSMLAKGPKATPEKDPSLDPFTIIAIVSAVIQFLQAWRNRRNAA